LTLSQVKQETIARCSSLFTGYLPSSSLNEFEEVIKDSIYIVLNGLCNWEWDIFEWNENYTTNLFESSTPMLDLEVPEPPVEQFDKFLDRTKSLLKWLGWSTWIDCPKKMYTRGTS